MELDLEKLERLLSEATELPWRKCKPCDEREGGCTFVWGGDGNGIVCDGHHPPPVYPEKWMSQANHDMTTEVSYSEQRQHQNMRLVVAAVNSLPALIQTARERDALRERAEALHEFLGRIAMETDWTIAEQMQVRDAATRLLAGADNRAATDAPDADPKMNA